MSKYKIENPNRQFNDWDAVEEQIANLDKKIDEAVAGEQSFANITGNPYDNTALSEALNEKADGNDIADLQSQINDKVDKVNGKELMPSTLPNQVNTNTENISNINTTLNNKVDEVTGYGLMPNDLPSRVTQNETDIQDLKDNKQDKMQFTEMPSPYTYLGKIVQYVGPTNNQYTNGLFYQGDYDSASLQYIWQPIGTSKGPEYEAGDGIEITDNVIKCTLLNDTITSTTTTWSSQKLRQEFEAIAGATKVYVVAVLPQVGELNSIYYQGTEAPYNIYLYTSNNEWVFIGTTGVNLQNYYTKNEVDNLINTYKPASGAGTIVAGSPQGMRINILCDNPLAVDNANQHLQLKYNEGLGANNNNELKVNIGAGLKLNGSNNTIEPDVDNNSVVLDSNNQISVQLKTVNNNSLYGTGNINISPTPTLIGQLTINTQSGQTICTLTENINNYNQIFIKVASNYADMGSLVLLKPSGTNGWIQGATHWYTYQNSLLLIGQNSIYNYYGNFYCVSGTQLNFTEIHSVIMNYSTGAITYSSPVGFTIYVYGI